MATIQEELEKRGIIPPGRERIDDYKQDRDQRVGEPRVSPDLWQQFAGQETLPHKAYQEGIRQFDKGYALERDRFGLDQDKFGELQRQFDKGYGLDRDRFGLDQDKFEELIRQFDKGYGLDRDRFGFDQYTYDRSQDLAEFLGLAPYTHRTLADQDRLAFDWTALMEEVVTHGPGGGTESDPDNQMVAAREYVEGRGGTIQWSRDGGYETVTINGKVIDVDEFGDNVGGTVYLPKFIIDAALGV